MMEIVKFLILLTVLISLSTVSADDAVIETNLWPEAENVPSLANGHLGFVIYGNSILMNGLYNGEKGESHRARIPNYSNVVTNAQCNQDVCAYTLDMRRGFFQNVITVASTHRVTQQLCAHRFFNRAIFNHFRLERATPGARLAVPLNIDAGEVPSVDLNERKVTVQDISGRNVTIRCYETRTSEDTRYQPTLSNACIGYTNPPSELAIEVSESVKDYLHITAVAKTEGEVVKELQDIFDALNLGADLITNHTAIWENHWNRFEISAEEGTKTNQIIHSSMFYLISSLPSEETNQPKDPFWGLSPGGLPKGGVLYMEYQGHSFWDTEMWMHPPILLLNPQWSKEILDYRYRTRKAAEDNAKNTGYGGYRYPWESGFTGREVTPGCCSEIVEYQHHIIADIAFAFRSHLAATRDLDWWEKVGCDIAFNTAKFWESRAKFNASTQLYDIRNVMGPDEDHHDIDNNVYTNVIAAINLYFGDFAGCACKDVLGISNADFEKFAKIARSLTLLYDEENDFHPQYEGYAGEEIKQADAVLLGYPLQYPMNASTKQNDLLYYDAVTRETGPAMTWAMHTIGFLDIDDEVMADGYFSRSYSLYTRAPFNVWSESIPGMPAAGNFITGAGGFLQSVINGYGGVRLHFDHLQITKSFVPKESTHLDFKGITYLNNVLSLQVNETSKTLTVVNFDPTHAIRVTANGAGLGDLTQGFSVTVPRDGEIILRPTATKCSLKATVVGDKVVHKRFDVIDDEWTLGSNYLPEYFDIPALSNGHVGFVVLGHSILLNGLYNGEKGESHRARIPNYSNITTNVECNMDNCVYHLHLKQGYFEQTTYDGNNFKITQQIYAHRYYNRAIVNRVVLEKIEGTAEVSVDLSLSPGDEDSVDLTLIQTKLDRISGHDVVTRCYETKLREDPLYQPLPSRVCISHTEIPPKLTVLATQGRAEFLHITAVGRTEEEVRKELFDIFTSENSYNSLFEKHTQAWERDFESYEISVADSLKLNQVFHSSMFYLLSNLPSSSTNQPKDPFWGLSPSGIARGGIVLADYQGHSFWDTEMWMHPPILLLNPQWSEEILDYRYRTRNAAEDNANFTGFEGYRYPWESGFTGVEVTPVCCPHVVEYQHHIIADIAFAFRSHLAATHDLDWWKNFGCDIAFNTAKFWESRVDFDDESQFYNIRSVMGPDEDVNATDKNVYTNVIAAINLYFGEFAGCTCKDVLRITDEDFENFSKIARSLKLLYDEENDFHPQYENYAGGEIKQADVVLVGYPLQFPMDQSTKRNNLIYYDNRTRDTGPAMTWSMHTIGYLDIQDQAEAAKNFERSWSVYTHMPFLTWSENQPGMPAAGNFITGMGGFLQSLINGYGGVRLHFDHLSISNFFMPQHSGALKINGLTYLNNRFSLEVSGREATLKFLTIDTAHSIMVTINPENRKFYPSAGVTLTINRDQELIMEPVKKSFGNCEVKKTEIGHTASAGSLKMSIILTICAIFIKSLT